MLGVPCFCPPPGGDSYLGLHSKHLLQILRESSSSGILVRNLPNRRSDNADAAGKRSYDGQSRDGRRLGIKLDLANVGVNLMIGFPPRSEFANEKHNEVGSSKQWNDPHTDSSAFFLAPIITDYIWNTKRELHEEKLEDALEMLDLEWSKDEDRGTRTQGHQLKLVHFTEKMRSTRMVQHG